LASLYLSGVLHGRRGDDRKTKIERKREKREIREDGARGSKICSQEEIKVIFGK
jgi:hypothetical protein